VEPVKLMTGEAALTPVLHLPAKASMNILLFFNQLEQFTTRGIDLAFLCGGWSSPFAGKGAYEGRK
jgi:hypothetical protein